MTLIITTFTDSDYEGVTITLYDIKTMSDDGFYLAVATDSLQSIWINDKPANGNSLFFQFPKRAISFYEVTK